MIPGSQFESVSCVDIFLWFQFETLDHDSRSDEWCFEVLKDGRRATSCGQGVKQIFCKTNISQQWNITFYSRVTTENTTKLPLLTKPYCNLQKSVEYTCNAFTQEPVLSF